MIYDTASFFYLFRCLGDVYFWVELIPKVGLHGLHNLGLTLIYIIDNQLIVYFFSKKV